MNSVYIMIERSTLDSGESSVHVTPFASRESALKDRENVVRSLEDEGYWIEWEVDNEIRLDDEENNTYHISVVEEAIRP